MEACIGGDDRIGVLTGGKEGGLNRVRYVQIKVTVVIHTSSVS